MNWPFADPRNTATITTVEVLERRAPILFVTHHAEDGAWEFTGPSGVPADDSDLRVIALDEVVRMDGGVVQLADLPLGWCASRSNQQSQWRRERCTS